MINNKFLIWSVIPNHYQDAFFRALRSEGVDLRVCYYEPMHAERLQMGWDDGSNLPEGEQYVPKTIDSIEQVADWRERIHVVPGCANRFLRQLARKLSLEEVPWVHWSEPSHPGLRRLIGWPVKRWYGNLINKHALGAIGIGQRALGDFQRWGVHPEKLAMVPYSSAELDPQTPRDEDAEAFCGGRHPVFVFLGALCKRKGIDVLLKAFAKVTVRAGGEAVLVLVGNDRSGGEYQQMSKTLSIESKVLFRGPVAPKTLGGILRSCDVLCLPSRVEGWGVVLNEAASMGFPLIASDQVGAAWHLIEPGENGFRVRAGDVESLARVMRAYIQTPTLANEHGTRSLKTFRGFTPKRNAQRFVNTMQSWLALRFASEKCMG